MPVHRNRPHDRPHCAPRRTRRSRHCQGVTCPSLISSRTLATAQAEARRPAGAAPDRTRPPPIWRASMRGLVRDVRLERLRLHLNQRRTRPSADNLHGLLAYRFVCPTWPNSYNVSGSARPPHLWPEHLASNVNSSPWAGRRRSEYAPVPSSEPSRLIERSASSECVATACCRPGRLPPRSGRLVRAARRRRRPAGFRTFSPDPGPAGVDPCRSSVRQLNDIDSGYENTADIGRSLLSRLRRPCNHVAGSVVVQHVTTRLYGQCRAREFLTVRDRGRRPVLRRCTSPRDLEMRFADASDGPTSRRCDIPKPPADGRGR